MGGGTVTMLSHARLTVVDPGHPASFSKPVVDLLRREWGYDGVLITDDFSMGAVYESPESIAGGGVAALNAGVDLILVSFDTDQYFVVMQGLRNAAAAGALHRAAMADSDRRLGQLLGGRR
jgi:beta-N-acetylhexosaminidase